MASAGWLKRLGLRWITVYAFLYIFLDNFIVTAELQTSFPNLGWFTAALTAYNNASVAIWAVVVPWNVQHVFGMQIAVRPVADQLFHYVQDGVLIVLSLLCAAVWTYVDRGNQRERTFLEITRTLSRYALAAIMFTFGFSKTFHLQFPYQGPIHLMEPLGDYSPYGLMWRFMGFSTPYSYLAGLAEITGGTLVLFRRTTTIGGVVIAGIMANVVLMNISYFVPARVEAIGMLILAIFLLVPNVPQFVGAAFGYQTAAVPSFKRLWLKRWMLPTALVLKTLVIALIVLPPLFVSLDMVRANRAAVRNSVRGLYRVESDATKGTTGGNDSNRDWERVAIEVDPYGRRTYYMAVRTADDSMRYYSLQIHETNKDSGVFTLKQCQYYGCSTTLVGKHPSILKYEISRGVGRSRAASTRAAEMTLRGIFGGESISAKLTRMDTSKYLLEHSPFHLVDPDNEPWIE